MFLFLIKNLSFVIVLCCTAHNSFGQHIKSHAQNVENIKNGEWGIEIRKTEYSLSSESTPRLTISDVLFCRRNNFCLAWHLDIWAAQST